MTHSDSRTKQDLSEHLDQAFPKLEDLRQAGHASGARQATRLAPGPPCGVCVPGTALFVSKGIEDLTGYPPDEFTSRRLSYNDIMLSEDRSATREGVLTAPAEAQDVRRRAPHPTQGRRSLLDLVARPRDVSLGRVPPLHRGGGTRTVNS
jgi:hypothetical protein